MKVELDNHLNSAGAGGHCGSRWPKSIIKYLYL